MAFKFSASPQRFTGCSPFSGLDQTNPTSQDLCTALRTVSKEVMVTRFLQWEANSWFLQETEIRDLWDYLVHLYSLHPPCPRHKDTTEQLWLQHCVQSRERSTTAATRSLSNSPHSEKSLKLICSSIPLPLITFSTLTYCTFNIALNKYHKEQKLCFNGLN